MSAREWKPGDVAMVDYSFGSERMLRDHRGWWSASTEISDTDESVIDARPLVVIDPEQITGPDETGGESAADEIVKCLRRLAETDHPSSYRRKVAERIADQIEVQAGDPKPNEPTGLGAVVEDADGTRWYLLAPHVVDRRWACWDAEYGDRDYDEIAAVRILSAGVES